MAMVGGFEDLKAKDVIAFDHSDGSVKVLYMSDGKLCRRQLQVAPTGTLTTAEIEPVPIDQAGERRTVPVSERWRTTDQGAHI